MLRRGTEQLSIKDVRDEGARDNRIDKVFALVTGFDKLIPAILVAICHVSDVLEELSMLYLEVGERGQSLTFSRRMITVDLSSVTLDLCLEEVESSAYLLHLDIGGRVDQDVVDGGWQF